MIIDPIYLDGTDYNIRGYIEYMNGVLDGSIVANEYVKLACQRMKDWFSRDDIYFDVDDVDLRIRFIYKLKHTEAPFTGKNFVLLPWQQFAIANIYGFKWKDTGRRVTRKVFIMISRKNGKSSLAAALTLCNLVCDRENGTEIDLVANSAKQAHICFKYISQYAQSVDPKRRILKTFRSEIRMPMTHSNIQVLCSDSMKLDGYNASVCIFDELHATKDWDLYNVMHDSQNARPQPLMITITTAGFLVGEMYPCYSMWQGCIEILRGAVQDDTQFSLIYQLDEGDDWSDESVWKKCCPSLGDTVVLDNMRDSFKTALVNKSQEVNCRTKIFNQWCSSAETWLPHDDLVNSMRDLDLEMFGSFPTSSNAYVGVDLAAVSDLTCVSLMVESEGKYYFKTYYFLPEEAVQNSVFSPYYKQWVKSGHIIEIPGRVTNYDYVLDVVKHIDSIIPIQGVYYDPWNAVQFSVNATNEGLPMFPFSQRLGNFNRPTKAFELLFKNEQVVIDYSPVTLWCFANVELIYDSAANCKPAKANAKGGKIDGVISMLECLGGYFIDNSDEYADLNIF